jgi:hypothetical protein
MGFNINIQYSTVVNEWKDIANNANKRWDFQIFIYTKI